MNKTKIEYLDYTWNPFAMRCTPCSEGCTNCWHIKRADMLNSNPKISHNIRLAYGGNAPPVLVPERLDDPLKRKKPSIIGVQFMGDLFHEDIPDHKINSIFLSIVHADWHTYLILTKRPQRMADFVSIGTGWRSEMPHVWLGVTVENQQRADEWIPILLQIPAAKYFISHEPGLGLINYPKEFLALGDRAWLITGGESGPGARPMHPDIPRHDRDQCQEAGVPFFFKQWGEWLPMSQGISIAEAGKRPDGKFYLNHQYDKAFSYKLHDGQSTFKIGKKKASRLLDGKIWNERP